MTVLAALIRDTFRESLARKIFWGFAGCSTALMLFLLFVLQIDLVEGSLAAVQLFGHTGTADVEELVDDAFGGIAAFLFTAGLFLAIFAAAGLIPTIFEPGRIELLLSKPVSRTRLLLGKYVGALAVVGLHIAYLVVGVWAILGWKTAVWRWEFLWAGALALVAFGVMLSVVTLVAVWSQSMVLSTMVAYVTLLISALTSQHDQFARLLDHEWQRELIASVHAALPKVFEMGDLARRLVVGREIEGLASPLGTSVAFAAVLLAAGVWLFERKDF